MKNKGFGEFIDKKKRDGIRQLGLVKKVLENSGLKVDNFLEGQEQGDSYIYCHNPSKNGSFDGIRIYKIGGEITFRIQKENKTHPFGSAYSLPIESMYNDILSEDNMTEKIAGRKIIDLVGKEIKNFFLKSIEAEEKEKENTIEKDEYFASTTGTDYSALVFNKGT